jgi:hypothetical protein
MSKKIQNEYEDATELLKPYTEQSAYAYADFRTMLKKKIMLLNRTSILLEDKEEKELKQPEELADYYMEFSKYYTCKPRDKKKVMDNYLKAITNYVKADEIKRLTYQQYSRLIVAINGINMERLKSINESKLLTVFEHFFSLYEKRLSTGADYISNIFRHKLSVMVTHLKKAGFICVSSFISEQFKRIKQKTAKKRFLNSLRNSFLGDLRFFCSALFVFLGLDIVIKWDAKTGFARFDNMLGVALLFILILFTFCIYSYYHLASIPKKMKKYIISVFSIMLSNVDKMFITIVYLCLHKVSWLEQRLSLVLKAENDEFFSESAFLIFAGALAAYFTYTFIIGTKYHWICIFHIIMDNNANTKIIETENGQTDKPQE